MEATQCASFYSQGNIYFLHVKLFIFLCFAYRACTSPFSVPTQKSWNYCALQFFLALAVAQTGGYLPSHTDLIVVD